MYSFSLISKSQHYSNSVLINCLSTSYLTGQFFTLKLFIFNNEWYVKWLTLWYTVKKYNKFVNVNPFFCEKFKLWCEWTWLKWIKMLTIMGIIQERSINGKMVIFLTLPVGRVGRGLNKWHKGGIHGSQCYTNQ